MEGDIIRYLDDKNSFARDHYHLPKLSKNVISLLER